MLKYNTFLTHGFKMVVLHTVIFSGNEKGDNFLALKRCKIVAAGLACAQLCKKLASCLFNYWDQRLYTWFKDMHSLIK